MVFTEGVVLLRRVWPRIARNILEGEDADWRRSLTKIFIPAPLCFVVGDEDLLLMAERTPGVESLILFGSSGITRRGFAKALLYWRNVTHLGVGERDLSLWRMTMDIEFLEEIGKSCPKLATLEISSSTRLETDAARVIVRSVPKLMTLRLEYVKVFKGAIKFIISNSPELKVIQLRSCDLRFENFPPSSASYRFSFDWTRKGDSEEWCFHYCSAFVTDDIEHKVEFPVSDDYDRWIH
ncbi:F-box/LRR-repeat protein [Corchorus olitorius]|uniref:F-box/LRR-repeat protein n=1 Tax=Corchorus olitorius TaxID=93759 RepID=A0A1R3GZV6_9ROSI|nr:F-box/LRR-repeat protein [Corchorus olitorius]